MRFLRAAAWVLLCALCTVFVAACGRKKTAPDVAARVVSLSPSTTEALYAIGAEAKLVGRSRYCDYPPAVLALPQVGGYVDPSIEAILALKPDLVVGARGPAGQKVAEKLAGHGVAAFFHEADSIAHIDAMIVEIGRRTGHEAGAQAAIEKLHARIVEVERAVLGAPRPRVLLVFGIEPISVAGPKSFADEMVRRAGGTNAVTEGASYPILGIEKIIALDPDIVLNATMAEAHGAERITVNAPGWKELRAVKAGHVAYLSDETMLRPGPRVGDGLAVIARAIHPGVAVP